MDEAIYAARLRPHRSLQPSQARLVVGFLALGCSIVSLPFFLLGAWPVVGFLGLDIVAVWWAFGASYRAARAYEDLRVTPLELQLDQVDAAGARRQWRFNPAWVRLQRDEHEEFGLQRLAFVSRGRAVEFAGFLGPDEKAIVARDLSDALAQARRGPVFA
ncbi:MAG: DUF2244 domain-containing protein [Hyphomicrobiales bacterium]|nr:DUF2244 domain-containing protein [Hyphomicrobiales bacterium]